MPPKPDLRFWKACVALFLVWWSIYVFGYGHWALVREHLGIAAVMIAGSVVAGSTPMGGGSVAFPILVYVFHETPENARNFGLVIQALGMTSALIFIFGRRAPVQKKLLWWSCAGAAAGMAAGTFLVAPFVARSLVKLLFSCLWMSFAVLTLARNAEFCALKEDPDLDDAVAIRTGLPVGLLGGIIASMIGVGLEMVVYTVLVLLFRCDLKIAVPTAVCATAVTSIIGTALHIGLGDIPIAIFGDWLAAAPIVVFGAPAGTWLVTIIPRIRLLYFVSFLCVFQFAYTLWQTRLNTLEWVFVGAVLCLAFVGFVALYNRGRCTGTVTI